MARPKASYPQLEVFGDAEPLELASAILFEGGCLGTEMLDEGHRLRAFFAPDTNVLPLAEALRGDPRLRVDLPPPLPERDWLLAWKQSVKGFALGERFYVLPTWLSPPVTGRIIVRLDPERAFGLGTHDTTRLLVELLERYPIDGLRVLDLGTGSGILAIVAAHLGASSVLAVDCDPDACACACTNVARNRLDGVIHIECTSWEDLPRMDADVVLANINAPVLARAVPHMQAKLVLLSGILLEEVDEIALPAGLRIAQTWSAGEWVALAAESP